MYNLIVQKSKKLTTWLIGDIIYILILFSIPQTSNIPLDNFLIAHFYGIFLATIVMYTGLGAGVLWFPFFHFMGCSPFEGVSLSLFTQIAGKGSGSIKYMHDHMIDWKIIRYFLPYAFIGVTIGYIAGFVMSKTCERWLLLVFVLVVIYLICIMIFSMNNKVIDQEYVIKKKELIQSWPIVVFSSFFTGLLSIGNSDWLVPYIGKKFKVPANRAIATSIFIMFSVALFFLFLTFISILIGLRQWPKYIPILLATCSGVILGGQIGARLINFSFLQNYQKHAFVIALTLSAMHMIWEFFTAY